MKMALHILVIVMAMQAQAVAGEPFTNVVLLGDGSVSATLPASMTAEHPADEIRYGGVRDVERFVLRSPEHAGRFILTVFDTYAGPPISSLSKDAASDLRGMGVRTRKPQALPTGSGLSAREFLPVNHKTVLDDGLLVVSVVYVAHTEGGEGAKILLFQTDSEEHRNHGTWRRISRTIVASLTATERKAKTVMMGLEPQRISVQLRPMWVFKRLQLSESYAYRFRKLGTFANEGPACDLIIDLQAELFRGELLADEPDAMETRGEIAGVPVIWRRAMVKGKTVFGAAIPDLFGQTDARVLCTCSGTDEEAQLAALLQSMKRERR